MGGARVKIYYDDRADLLYLRFDERKQELMNRRVTEDIVLDIGKAGKIVGIEILDASKHLDLASVLPIQFAPSKSA